MNYLMVAIISVAKRPYYLFVFILFRLLGLPVSIMKQIGIIQPVIASVLMICIIAFSTFLETGVYALSWEYVKGEKATFIAGAKKYFPHVLGASIVIGIIASFAVLLFLGIHKFIMLPDISTSLYHKRIDAIVMRNIPEFIISGFFVYAIPAIFARNLSGKNAVSNSWRFVLKYYAESRIVIILLLITTIIEIITTKWAVNFDYSSVEYWKITALSSILTSTLLFFTFLSAAQIFDRLFTENENT